MLIGEVQPTTIVGIKRRATQIKQQLGIKHTDALDLAARSANCDNFRHALRVLPHGGNTATEHILFLTGYWRSPDDKTVGRETLQLKLSRPILDICSKLDLKQVRGFGKLRMVAADHFVSDLLSKRQEYVRSALCKAARSLKFMEYTGLRPFHLRGRDYSVLVPSAKLPNTDHETDWQDPESGQFILIDEPYGGVPDEGARQAWAREHGWHISKAEWPGMYFPYQCDLYVATQDNGSFDFDKLLAKINAMPVPVLPGTVEWHTAPTFDAFVSPAARTPQDWRRARSKGTIMPRPSAATVPYRIELGAGHRRPAGSMSLTEHEMAGRIITAALETQRRYSRIYRHLDKLRTRMEIWLGCEPSGKQLDNPAFFDVYFSRKQIEDSFSAAAQSTDGTIHILGQLRQMLTTAYPNCRPLRDQIRRIDLAVAAIQKQSGRVKN